MADEMAIDDAAEEALGPKMRVLTERQRRFVKASLDFPTGKDWQIAKAAGYGRGSHGALRVQAHQLRHNERIIAALHEEAGKRLRSSVVLGVSVLAQIAATPGHKDQLKAATALLNRTGFHETSEHRVMVEKTDATGTAMVERIKKLAGALGLDPSVLLGPNAAPAFPKMIEGEVVEAKDGRQA